MFSHTGEPSSREIMMHSATWRSVASGVDSSRVSRQMDVGSIEGAGWVLESTAGAIVDAGMADVDGSSH